MDDAELKGEDDGKPGERVEKVEERMGGACLPLSCRVASNRAGSDRERCLKERPRTHLSDV